MSGDKAQMSVGQAINAALADAMAADDKVFIIGEDVADLEGGGVLGVTTASRPGSATIV